MTFVRFAALALAIVGAAFPSAASAHEHIAPGEHRTSSAALDALIAQLTAGSLALVDEQGQIHVTKSRGLGPVQRLSERDVINAIATTEPVSEQIVRLWELFADRENSAFATVPIITALASSSTHPQTREALWSELAALSRVSNAKEAAQPRSLLALFEQHREHILPLLPPVRETEGAGDEMAHLMTHSQVFGGDIWESLSDMVKRNPAAVARHIERQRERGQPVKWEYQGFEGLMKWRDTNFIAAARQHPQSPAALDAAGETFIAIFNSLHTLDDWFRVQMLKGLGPADLFNAVVSGEQTLYQLGTSGYRDFLHPIILQGIKASGTFEAFVARAAPHAAIANGPGSGAKRALVFMRIASSFGLLDSVLETVRDRDAFVTDAIAALGDPRSFEGSSAMVVEFLTDRTVTPQSAAFQRALLDRLYALYAGAADPARRSVYGSMLSAYQTVTGDRRDRTIDRDFPLDGAITLLPFERLFKPAGKSQWVHRIFMRMHDDLDAGRTYISVRALMKSLGASAREDRHYTTFRIVAPQRTIEIYVNNPDAAGVREGIADIGKRLRGGGVETIIGRGHTGIITSLQADSRRVLGDSIRSVAAVIVGTCGSDASVRDLISTFGYAPFITTRSSGHQSINNAIIETYITALLALQPGGTLSMASVLDRALARFLKEQANEELREDAKLYRVNTATALAAQLFDTHVKRFSDKQLRVSR